MAFLVWHQSCFTYLRGKHEGMPWEWEPELDCQLWPFHRNQCMVHTTLHNKCYLCCWMSPCSVAFIPMGKRPSNTTFSRLQFLVLLVLNLLVRAYFFCHLIPSSSCFPACHCLYFDKNTSLTHLFIIQIDFKCEELLCTLSGRVNFCQNKRDRMDMHTSSVLSPQGILCDKGRLAISNNHKDGL